MVEYKVIKVSKKNYDSLLREASRIQYETGKKATFDDAVGSLVSGQVENQKIGMMKYFGIWGDMSDEEAAEFDKIREDANKENKKRSEELWN